MKQNPEQICRLYEAHEPAEVKTATVEQILRNEGHNIIPWNDELHPRNDVRVACRWIIALTVIAATLMVTMTYLSTQ